MTKPNKPDVLQKYIAASGLTSRRQAEEYIRQGVVTINGVTAKLGDRASDTDVVKIGKKAVSAPAEFVYIKLNKPADYVCTTRDFKGEKNIFELIDLPQRLFVVGRLDKNSRGLVLLTNDGALAQNITHPKFEHEKEYEVIAKKPEWKIPEISEIISRFQKGVRIGNGAVGRAKMVQYLGDGKFRIILTQGKKRQIRKMFEAVGLEIADLLRIRIANIKLGTLKSGEWKYLDQNEKIN